MLTRKSTLQILCPNKGLCMCLTTAPFPPYWVYLGGRQNNFHDNPIFNRDDKKAKIVSVLENTFSFRLKFIHSG